MQARPGRAESLHRRTSYLGRYGVIDDDGPRASGQTVNNKSGGKAWMMATEQPNVLLILADDIGWFDVGAYHRGIMGCRTPNAIVQQHVATFEEFPPRQSPAGFNPQGLVEEILRAAAERQGN